MTARLEHALQLIDPIVADLIKNENGVVMYDSLFEREVVVVCTITLYIMQQ